MGQHVTMGLALAWGAPLALAILASMVALRVDPRLVALVTVITAAIGYTTWIAVAS